MWVTADGDHQSLDEDWHIICQAIYKSVEGLEWVMYYKYMEMHKNVNLRKPMINKKAGVLWALKNAKENGQDYHDQSSERQIERRSLVRQASWEAHVISPTAALEDSLRCTEDGARRAQSSAAREKET